MGAAVRGTRALAVLSASLLLPLGVLAALGPPAPDVSAPGPSGGPATAAAASAATPAPGVVAGEEGGDAAGSTAVPTAPSAGSSAGPSTTPLPVVARGTGELLAVAGQGRRSGPGPLRTVRVEVEGGLGVDPGAFARAVETVLSDPRSWGSSDRLSFQRTDGEADVVVTLASPATTDRLCAPLTTGGRFSCANGARAVINSMRWLRGADAYAGDLDGYRRYVVNHEVGHVLGNGHVGCPSTGTPAPVMVQQTIGLQGCTKNPWPYP